MTASEVGSGRYDMLSDNDAFSSLSTQIIPSPKPCLRSLGFALIAIQNLVSLVNYVKQSTSSKTPQALIRLLQ